jgi:cytoskeletal protein CcmA (bactofilin family)
MSPDEVPERKELAWRPASDQQSPARPSASCAERPATPTYNATAVTSELRIDSRTDGSIHYAGAVCVSAQGTVSGEIHAKIIAVEGEITGDLHADEAIRLAATARVHGDLYAPRVAVARGAQLQGRINMRRSAELEAALDDFTVSQVLAGKA